MIVLEENCRVSRADGTNTFEVKQSSVGAAASTGVGQRMAKSKSYYLTADTQPLMEDWVRTLQAVVQRTALESLLRSRADEDPTLQGWLTKVKNGHSKKVWCILLGKMFVYFR